MAEPVGRLVADERDAAMAELEEIARRHRAAFDVVDHHRRKPVDAAVDEHGRDAGRLEAHELVRRRDHGHDQQPVGAVRVGEQPERAAQASGRLHVEEREVVLGLAERGDDPADTLDRGRVGEERRDHADDQRPFQGQVPGN